MLTVSAPLMLESSELKNDSAQMTGMVHDNAVRVVSDHILVLLVEIEEMIKA